MPSTPVTISSSRLLKQYLRWLPAQLGMVNKGAFLLQINNILPDDIFIVSYPKSGNTWLRYILAYALKGTERELSFDELEDVVSDVYTSKDLIDSKTQGRFIKTHDAYFNYFPKTVYIYRDYRDVLVSFYEYKLALKEYTGNFSDFIRSEEVNKPFGSWKEHVSKAFAFHQINPGSVLLLKYEDLLSNFEIQAQALLAFCGIKPFDLKQLKTATGFNQLQQTENQKPGEFKKRSGKNFFREGKQHAWRKYFKPEDLEYIYADTQLKQLLDKSGYDTAL